MYPIPVVICQRIFKQMLKILHWLSDSDLLEHFGENRVILLQTVAKWRCIKLSAILSGPLCMSQTMVLTRCYKTAVFYIQNRPERSPLIQCHSSASLTGRAWAPIQTIMFRISLYESLPVNCWNTLSVSSSVMIGSVEFLLLQNSVASYQLNTEPLV